MSGPGFDAKTAAEFDRYLDPPELSEVTEEEMEDARIVAEEEEFEDMRDRGVI